MASVNSSQARVFACVTARAAAHTSRCLSAPSGVPQANHSQQDSFFSFKASRTAGVHHRVQGLPPRQAPQTLRPQLWAAASTTDAENIVHSDSMSPTSPWHMVKPLPEVGVEYIPGRRLHQTFPGDPYYKLVSAKSVRLSPLPADPTHH
ncbi:hypothetical protein ILYODFUR_031139 [Ilyodon furcidens]|uniref:Uncharacterized protein n=1 Tax=Ilyodon furcidens TaxID=33524 RepID=A0ABV0TSE3_9TELE